MRYDYLIVGAGLFGATFAYRAKKAGKRVLVIDKRKNVGGNVRCKEIGGIQVHCYGPHIFHTKSEKVWNFVNQFVPFNRFTLNTIANYKGKLYNLPFNMNTFHQIWNVNTPMEAWEKIQSQRYSGAISNLEEQALSLVGKDVFQILIKGYTEKQWGKSCNELPPFIIKRLPVRLSYDNNYFDDPYQGIPIGGYNKLIEALLDGVEVKTNCDFFDAYFKSWSTFADKLVYTGKLDDFYENRFGSLDYRSLMFKTEILQVPNYQGIAIMNYTDASIPYTRIIEHKHFAKFGDAVYEIPNTVITKEYPLQYKPKETEPYYPINDKRNNELYKKYKALAEKEENVIFGGRLADYQYYNMDQVIEKCLSSQI